MSINDSNPDKGNNSGTDEIAKRLRIQIEDRVEFSRRQGFAESSFVAHDTRTGKFYQLGLSEYHACTLLDGSRSLAEVHGQLSSDGVNWTLSEVAEFATELMKHRLAKTVQPASEPVHIPSPALYDASQQIPETVTGQADELPDSNPPSEDLESIDDDRTKTECRPSGSRISAIAGVLRAMSAVLSQRIPLADGDRVAKTVYPLTAKLFGKPALVAWTLLVASGWAVIFQKSEEFGAELTRLFDSQLWLVLIGIWVVLKGFHEIGHAVCAKHHGVRVGRMGIMFFMLAPLAYVEVTDAWKLKSRSKRVQIALAGIYFELAIGAIAAILWWSLPIGFIKHVAAQVFLMAGPATLLINANPLLRLDGYYVLSDWLEIPNLRMHGRNQLTGWIESKLIRIPRRPALLTGWRQSFATAHAACSIIFQIIWMTTLVIAVSYWAKGLGLVVGVIAVLMRAVIPLVKWTYKIWNLEPRRGWRLSSYQRRFIGVAMVGFVIVQYLATAASPLDRRVPVVVRYQNEQIARASADAFVKIVHVRCGQRVIEGQILIELEQPELMLKRDQLADQRELAKLKSIQHHKRGELRLAKSEEQVADSLRRQIHEVNIQISQLKVHASRDGIITSPETDRLTGQFVTAGEVLVHVSDPREKEVLAIIDQTDMVAFQGAAYSEKPATVRLRGGKRVSTMLQRVRPSALRSIPHPALSATVGGPLPVQPYDQSDEMQLVEPQLISVCPLDSVTSVQVRAGQTGRLTIPDDRSLLTRVWEFLNRGYGRDT